MKSDKLTYRGQVILGGSDEAVLAFAKDASEVAKLRNVAKSGNAKIEVNGLRVLFWVRPCDINGLKSYLRSKGVRCE